MDGACQDQAGGPVVAVAASVVVRASHAVSVSEITSASDARLAVVSAVGVDVVNAVPDAGRSSQTEVHALHRRVRDGDRGLGGAPTGVGLRGQQTASSPAPGSRSPRYGTSTQAHELVGTVLVGHRGHRLTVGVSTWVPSHPAATVTPLKRRSSSLLE